MSIKHVTEDGSVSISDYDAAEIYDAGMAAAYADIEEMLQTLCFTLCGIADNQHKYTGKFKAQNEELEYLLQQDKENTEDINNLLDEIDYLTDNANKDAATISSLLARTDALYAEKDAKETALEQQVEDLKGRIQAEYRTEMDKILSFVGMGLETNVGMGYDVTAEQLEEGKKVNQACAERKADLDKEVDKLLLADTLWF